MLQTVVPISKIGTTGEENAFRFSPQGWSNDNIEPDGTHRWSVANPSTVGGKDNVWFEVDFIGTGIDIWSQKNTPFGEIKYTLYERGEGDTRTQVGNPVTVNQGTAKTNPAKVASFTNLDQSKKYTLKGQPNQDNKGINCGQVIIYHTPYEVTSINVAEEAKAVTVKQGGSKQLAFTVLPAYADATGLEFTSSDDETVTVDDTGVVKGLKIGEANVTIGIKGKDEGAVVVKVTVEEAVPQLKGIIGDIDYQYTEARFEEVKNAAKGDSPKTTERLTAWKNDKALSVLALISDESALEDVTITTSNLVKKEGEGTIDKSKVKASFIRSTLAYNGPFLGYGTQKTINDFPAVTADNRSESADVIFNAESVNMGFNEVQAVWLEFSIPADAKEGIYETTVQATAKGISEPITFTYEIEVKNAVLPNVENFSDEFSVDFWHHPYASADYYGVTPFSDEHFAILKPIMELYKEVGGGTVYATMVEEPWNAQTWSPYGRGNSERSTYPSMIKWISNDNGQTFTFDYTVFDEWIEFNIEEVGLTGDIALFSIAPWHFQFRWFDDSGRLYSKAFDYGTEYNRIWKLFLTDLFRHLEQQGWLDKTYIALDEQGIRNEALSIIETVESELNLDIKIMGYLDGFTGNKASNAELQKRMDFVSFGDFAVQNQLSTFKTLLEERNEQNQKSILYSCTEHRPGQFALSQPVESYWAVANAKKQGTTGFSRWAWDAWTENALEDATSFALEPGDCFLIYPDVKEKGAQGTAQAYSSVRLARMAQAVRDMNKVSLMVKEYPNDVQLRQKEQALYDAITFTTSKTTNRNNLYLSDTEVTQVKSDVNNVLTKLNAMTDRYIEIGGRGGINGVEAGIPKPLPVEHYILDTDGVIEDGGIYSITYYYDAGVNFRNNSLRMLFCNNTETTNVNAPASSGYNENGYFIQQSTNAQNSKETQLWKAIKNEDGTFYLQAMYNEDQGGAKVYLDVTQNTGDAFAKVSTTPKSVTIAPVDPAKPELGQFTVIDHNSNMALGYSQTGSKFVGTAKGNAVKLYFHKQTYIDEIAQEDKTKLEIPEGPKGTTYNEPFPLGTGGSNNFRIPCLVTIDSGEHKGRIVAAADMRWNHDLDGRAIDLIVSYSDDNGKTWHYNSPLYFNDSIDPKPSVPGLDWVTKTGSDASLFNYATTIMDPGLIADKNGKLYVLADLFAGGSAIEGIMPLHPESPDTGNNVEANGFLNADNDASDKELVLYGKTKRSQAAQDDTNYDYWVGDYVKDANNKEFAPVYAKDDRAGTTPKYYIDRKFYLYDANKGELYCDQIMSVKNQVKQNIFFYNADLYVRLATYLVLVTSEDGGETWSDPVLVNDQVNQNQYFYGLGPGAGMDLDDGTIIFPMYKHTNGAASERSSLIYSTDEGKTWTRTADSVSTFRSSESVLVKINNNRLRQFMRSDAQKLNYVDWIYSKDEAGNVTLTTTNSNVQLAQTTTYNNQISAITLKQKIDGKTAILVSNATTNGGNTAVYNDVRGDGRLYLYTVNEDSNYSMNFVAELDVWPNGLPADQYPHGVDYNLNQGKECYTYSSLVEKIEDGKSMIHLLVETDFQPARMSYKKLDLEAVFPDVNFDPLTEDQLFNEASGLTVAATSATEASVSFNAGYSVSGNVTYDVVVTKEDGSQVTTIADTTEVSHKIGKLTKNKKYIITIITKVDGIPKGQELTKVYTHTYGTQPEGEIKVPEGIWITGVEAKDYTGSKLTQSFALYDGDVLLKEKVDYTVSYKNNTKAYLWMDKEEPGVAVLSEGPGLMVADENSNIVIDPDLTGENNLPSADKAKNAPQMIITMKGNYTGKYTVYFEINPISLEDEDIVADDIMTVFNNKVQKATPVITWKGKKLTNKDFEVAYPLGYDAKGNASAETINTLLLKGKGNFADSIQIDFIIHPTEGVTFVPMSKVSVSKVKNLTFDATQTEGMKQTEFVVKAGKNQVDPNEYTVRYEKNDRVGTATMVLEGNVDIGDDKTAFVGVKRITFKINGNSMSKVKVEELNKDGYPFTGEKIQPLDGDAKVTFNGNPMEKGSYTVRYENNLNRGTGTIILTGVEEKGFTGVKKQTFKIVAASIENTGSEKFQVEIVDEAKEEGGNGLVAMPFTKGGVKPAVQVTDAVTGKTLKEGSDYTVSYKNNTKRVDYTGLDAAKADKKAPVVIVTGKGNYSGKLQTYFEIIAKDLSDAQNADDLSIVVKDLVVSTKNGGWKSAIKVVDANSSALSKKEAKLSEAEYRIYELPADVTDQQLLTWKTDKTNLNTKDIKTTLPAGTKVEVTVKMVENGDYIGEVTGIYRILKTGYDISKATIKLADQVYTGKNIEIDSDSDFVTRTITVAKGQNPVTLTMEGDNPTLEVVPGSYVKNVNKGTAKVTFRGRGEFGGTKTVSFKISQRNIANNWDGLLEDLLGFFVD